MARQFVVVLAFASVLSLGSGWSHGEDWPAWRYDARRGNASPMALPDELRLAWSRDLQPPAVTWPDQEKLAFHRVLEPIVVGRSLVIGSSRTDDVTAFDTRTGERKWVFRADGPIRFAPVADAGRIYVASDDGYLYCLDGSDGSLQWRYRGGPAERRVLGNERFVSLWPARGAPVVEDGVVYFAASIWPFMGIFIHALDAESGEVVWTNDGDGSMFIKQPHNTDSFAGVAPQGPLVVAGERLLIPGGRSVPACYDRRTGRFLYYELAENGKRGGGFEVVSGDELFFNGEQAFLLEDGTPVGSLRGKVAVADDGLYVYSDSKQRYEAYDWDKVRVDEETKTDRRGREYTIRKLVMEPRWLAEAVGGETVIKAGERLYGAAEGTVVAISPPKGFRPPGVTWQAKVEGTVARLIAADERLFAVTVEGRVHAFADATTPATGDPQHFALEREALGEDAAAGQLVQEIIEHAPLTKGYALVLGVGDGGVVREMLRQTDMHVVAVDADAERVNALREGVTRAGLYGDRCSVHVGDASKFALPPYFASVVVAGAGIESPKRVVQERFDALRPYGGSAWAVLDATERGELAKWVESEGQEGSVVNEHEQLTTLVRGGGIPEAGNWTHEHADAANSRVSPDAVVRAPLGILWFGGASNEGVLPRHGHGPQPQVIDGRLIIEGPDMMRATDIYTGRVLWQRDFEGIGFFFDNLGHQPGANGSGTNFISQPDGVYVVYEGRCLVLDLDTGATLRTYKLSSDSADGEGSWTYLNVLDGYVIAGSNPLVSETDDDGRPAIGKNDNLSGSRRLHVLDRESGEELWQVEATNYFRHNAICAGGGRLYAVDLLSETEQERMKRRGETPDTVSALRVYDLATGQDIWGTEADVFGTWLSYSAEHDVLIEAGRPGRDVLSDEARGMRAYRASDGDVLWKADHDGPAMLHGDVIHVPRAAYDLLTGEPVQRTDPVTGESVAWTWTRNYGCNQPIVSQHLVTFRSGAAGYYDLANDGGTGNFGGFRSGCTNNLIAAGGILSAPDYTRTCVCSYQNQSSLALVHMPEAEMWTEFVVSRDGPVRHLSWNVGAPGSRRASDGTLWLHEFDGLEIRFDGTGYYSDHSTRVADGDVPGWIASSGCRGIQEVQVDLRTGESEGPSQYTVRLYFCDPDFDEAGKRNFDVTIQGAAGCEGVDIAAAGGRYQPIMREVQGVEARDRIVIEFSDDVLESGDRAAILSGLEVIREE